MGEHDALARCYEILHGIGHGIRYWGAPIIDVLKSEDKHVVIAVQIFVLLVILKIIKAGDINLNLITCIILQVGLVHISLI
ncbi:hypothetical protein D3C73_377980 [compost metagenome]